MKLNLASNESPHKSSPGQSPSKSIAAVYNYVIGKYGIAREGFDEILEKAYESVSPSKYKTPSKFDKGKSKSIY